MGERPRAEAGLTSFGRTLRLLRRRAGMSQPRLAATVFVSQPTVSRFESVRVGRPDAGSGDGPVDRWGAGGGRRAVRPDSG
ncbi:helix-turn-helix domain-containing protein [Kitasatospora sp. NPDC059817]|uniref:helix-turn-helix domain-containing protein n=1 Tax=Kitasatospora sp. NPDC059817 TaxID=3346961 RepID=UPI003646D981